MASIVRRHDGYAALCEACARPLERVHGGKWVASEPIYERADRAA